MKPLRFATLLLAAGLLSRLSAAERLTVTVTHSLDIARPAETISIPWARVASALPGALIHHLEVRDAAGHVLPYQVTNLVPTLKDATGRGDAYGELLFQHDFAAGEKSTVFTLVKTEAVTPPFPVKAFARYVPERLDDFAWENDKIAHRIYGPGLAAPAPAGSGKEVLVSSGIDVWCKRVSYPIVDRWYNKGHNFYHKYDLSEGMDMYNVSQSRGCGGTGIWNGHALAVSSNYHGWKVLENGPVRAVFELTYDAWQADGFKVAETKRFTVEAGHNLDRMESTFTVTEGSAAVLTVAIGLHKTPTDKGQDPKIDFTPQTADGSLTQWVVQKTHGELATAVIVPNAAFSGYAEDKVNRLVLAKVTPGQPLHYLVGAGWSAAGEFATEKTWTDYVAACAARERSPVTVTFTTTP